MKRMILKGTLAGLACMGMVMPVEVMAAAPTVPQKSAQKVQIADVALNQGKLSGRVVNSQGETLDGSVVKVSLGSKVVGSTVTNADGEFEISNLKGGLYQVAAGGSQSVVRLWDAKTAPPAAKEGVLIVNGATARAQGRFGGNGTLLLVGGTIIAAGTTIAIIESQDDDDPAPVSP